MLTISGSIWSILERRALETSAAPTEPYRCLSCALASMVMPGIGNLLICSSRSERDVSLVAFSPSRGRVVHRIGFGLVKPAAVAARRSSRGPARGRSCCAWCAAHATFAHSLRPRLQELEVLGDNLQFGP